MGGKGDAAQAIPPFTVHSATGTVTYDEPVDLGVYDGFMGVA